VRGLNRSLGDYLTARVDSVAAVLSTEKIVSFGLEVHAGLPQDETMQHLVIWLTCPNCKSVLDLAADGSGDYRCGECCTLVMVFDTECLFTSPGVPGQMHRCTLERLLERAQAPGFGR
jgi:hypothetical protein